MTDSELDEEQTPDELFRTAVLVEGGLGAIALGAGYLVGPSARDLVPTTEQWEAIVGGIGLGIVATIPLLLFMSVLRRIKHPAIEKLDELSDHPMIGLMLKLNAWELLAISLCAGVGEELLFRGWLMPFLASMVGEGLSPTTEAFSLLPEDVSVDRPWWAWGGFASQVALQPDATATWTEQFSSWWTATQGWPMVVALIGSSVLFGFVHPMTKLYIFVTGMMGFYFAVLLILSGNLLIPIVAHALYDAVQLWSAASEAKATGTASD
ncbi:CPBP family intramembrane glutamic endopeptidase [Neorhodopirellula lusitana]|uniref:CPBP family intramembrane glutamic endopeptidase n=1 Tax=Neorhodopirellula lusitana TaxID=445327 RepID=UPI003850856F